MVNYYLGIMIEIGRKIDLLHCQKGHFLLSTLKIHSRNYSSPKIECYVDYFIYISDRQTEIASTTRDQNRKKQTPTQRENSIKNSI